MYLLTQKHTGDGPDAFPPGNRRDIHGDLEMAKTQDFTKVMQDMMASFPVDASSLKDTFKTQAAFGEKMTKVALEAAEKSNEISSKWTRETIAKVGSLAKVKDEPADYSKAFSDFASAAAEMAAENMAAFAEVAKKVQMETVELMLAAGKDFSEDASSAVKKATTEVTAAAKKVAAAAK
jgi:Phasin protein